MIPPIRNGLHGRFIAASLTILKKSVSFKEKKVSTKSTPKSKSGFRLVKTEE